MAHYRFVSVWRLAAPVEAVWAEIEDAEHWPSWWPSVRKVQVLEPGDESGLGKVLRFTFATRLPYALSFDSRIVRAVRPRLVEGRAEGELEGTGRWELEPAGDRTVARYTWDVRTAKAWMNVLAPMAGPAFRWNHDALMREGAERLAQRLGVPLLEASGEQEEGPSDRTLAAVLVTGLVAASLFRRARHRARHRARRR